MHINKITNTINFGYNKKLNDDVNKKLVEQKVAQLVELLSQDQAFSAKNQKEREDILFRKAIVELA